MPILKQKQGFSFAAMLGIVTFVTILVASLFVFVHNTSILINRDIETEEAYVDAYEKVDATIRIIMRENAVDPVYLAGLASFLGISIALQDTGIWKISSPFANGKEVISYFEETAGSTTTQDLLLQYTGLEPGFIIPSFMTVENILASYLIDYRAVNFPLAPEVPDIIDFQDLIDYLITLRNAGYFRPKVPTDLQNQVNPTVDSNWFVTGSVVIPNNKSLTVLDGFLLVIDGNLTMNQNSILSGNIIVNGSVTIKGKGGSWETVRATIYMNGTFTGSAKMNLGPVERPAFVLTTGNVLLGNNTTGHGYFLCVDFLPSNKGNVTLTGGIYASGTAVYPNGGVDPNLALLEEDLYDLGIPITIHSEAGGGEISAAIIYTLPRRNDLT